MQNQFYNFLLNMWIMKQIDMPKLQSYVPMFISQNECNMILTTPQIKDSI